MINRFLNRLRGNTNERVIHHHQTNLSAKRQLAADLYLRGEGIEIGALHQPLKVPATARVKYVDRLTVEELRTHYVELAELPLVEVDIIDDGETLATIPDGKLDFVIANHFFEHCQDPIFTLENLLRVLKTGGIIYLAVPDKRFTRDVRREVTSLEHLERDHREGPDWSRRQHYDEWVRLWNGVEDEQEVQLHINHLMNVMNYSIHFHVWSQFEMLELLAALRKRFGLPFELEMFLKNEEEMIMILRKQDQATSE